MLSSGLVHLLDDEGFPHARHMGLIRPLLACWTRCRLLGEQIKGGCWSQTAERQYGRLVRNAVRLARCDGTHAFSNRPADDDAALLAAALRLCNDEQSRRIARLALPRHLAAGRAACHWLCQCLPRPAEPGCALGTVRHCRVAVELVANV